MRYKEAVLRDLESLRDELPGLIEAVRSGDESAYKDAVALITGGSRARTQLILDTFVDYVFTEAQKGNSAPLNELALSTATHNA